MQQFEQTQEAPQETPQLSPAEARGDFLKEPAPAVAEAEEPEIPEVDAEEEEAAPARDEKGKFTGKGIPKERFDQAVGKERAAREAAEQRVAALQAELGQREQQVKQSEQVEQLEANIEALEEQHATFLLDGEAKKAAEVMRQIRHAEREIARAEMRRETREVTAQVKESENVELTIATLEAENPTLNPQSEEYSEPLVNFILSEQRRLMRDESLSPSRALNKAATTILSKFGPQASATAQPAQGLGKTQAARKGEAVTRNLEVQKRQPASMKDSGMDSDKAGQTGPLPDISKMSAEEYNALPASTRSRMRGDNL